jgi:hypothetical protein
MLEELAARILDRQHFAGAAEWLAGRSSCHQVGRPISLGSHRAKLLGFEFLNVGGEQQCPLQMLPSVANGHSRSLVGGKGGNAVRVEVNSADSPETGSFESDVQTACSGEQGNGREPSRLHDPHLLSNQIDGGIVLNPHPG